MVTFMTSVVSVINLKGGVGKTTLTVALSEFLAQEDGEDVLVIDLDPQTNATVALISQERWKKLDDAGRTLAQLFKDAIVGTSEFDSSKAIVSKVSNLHGGISSLRLLPSSLNLIDLQEQVPLIPSITHYTVNPVEILNDAIKDKLGDYDYVLIDCPPNLGIITQNGLRISDHYLIPVIPDILSTLGIPQILKQVTKFSAKWPKKPTPLGIVISKRRGIGLHETITRQLRGRAGQVIPDSAPPLRFPNVFRAEIGEAGKTAEAMEFEKQINTVKQKYGYSGAYETYREFVDEFKRACR